MTQFFKKFPVISYANTSAVNLLARVNMTKMALANKQAYYSYSVPEGERPDNLSYNYYDNPDFVWLINLTNQVMDPYYDYPISFDNLNTLITNKYGSYSKAQNTILFFRNNWITDESNISPAAYAALTVDDTQNLKKYWAPEIDNNNNIFSYVRKQEDWEVSTNQVQQLGILYVAPEGGNAILFTVGELISQDGITAIATISSVSSEFIVIHHISGSAVVGPIVGLTSGATGTVNSITTLVKNFPDSEAVYWSPVTAYDYEHELNSAKKNIKLLDNKYTGQATKELKNLLAT
jgi:hypothetical protein